MCGCVHLNIMTSLLLKIITPNFIRMCHLKQDIGEMRNTGTSIIGVFSVSGLVGGTGAKLSSSILLIILCD